MRVLRQVFDLLSSLKMAVFVLTGLLIALIAATLIESAYDTPTAQYYVYRTPAFYGLLALLGVNIICVALSRLPWKPRHLPFLLAHLGIVLLLLGSGFTYLRGLDGSMRISEGATQGAVELDSAYLVIKSSDQAEDAQPMRIIIPWRPPESGFSPIKVGGLPDGLKLSVEEYLTHADIDMTYSPIQPGDTGGFPAIEVKIVGGPMKVTQKFWLWAGDPQTQLIQAGPAQLAVAPADGMPSMANGIDPAKMGTGPRLIFRPQSDGSIRYQAWSSAGSGTTLPSPHPGPHQGTPNPHAGSNADLIQASTKASKTTSLGQKVEGNLPSGFSPGTEIKLNWRMATVTVERYIPRAFLDVKYTPSLIQYGTQAPPSAIRVAIDDPVRGVATAPERKHESTWLGLGDRATLQLGRQIDGKTARTLEIGYYPHRIALPFGIKLHEFKVEHYEGTNSPKEYSSRVQVQDHAIEGLPVADARKLEPSVISMNEPLVYRGYTFFQASFEDAVPRPTTTILSVNQDPGRRLKYIGSLLIVIGSVWLFASKLKIRKVGTTPAPAQPSPASGDDKPSAMTYSKGTAV